MSKPRAVAIEKDLLAVVVLSFVLILTAFLVPDSPLRIALGFPFVLFFPGYALVCALFPRKNDLGLDERIALSLGLSLAIIPLIGLILNYTPFGIKLIPLLFSMFTVTVLLSFISNYRRSKMSPTEKFTVYPQLKISTKSLSPSDRLFAVAILLVIVILASTTGYLSLTPKTGDRFTEFYILGANRQLNTYPTNLTLGQSGVVTIGIVNHESTNMTYRLTVTLNNQTIDTVNAIALTDRQSWEQNYTFTPQQSGDRISLGFHLYKESDANESYRDLQLLITVRPSQ
jgi:uncharacterized membrane protein